MKTLSVLFICILLSTTLFALGNQEDSVIGDSDSGDREDPTTISPRILEDGFKELTVNGFMFRWRIRDENIEFTMEAPTQGWVAVGFKPSIMMKDADYILGYVKDGEVFATDDFGVGNVSHQPDTRQGGSDDISILGGREVDNRTTIQISRPLNSGDIYDQPLAPGETLKVLFAWGSDLADNFTSHHDRRGSFTLKL